MNVQYDVAFSYAGEQREYVEATYSCLQQSGISVFYDRSQLVDLWGSDLYQHLVEVYTTQAKYCVVFLSKDYADKLWTKHELKSIQARAFQEPREYLLPARFDDTEIPGLLPQIAYINLQNYSPVEFAELIVRKVRSNDVGSSSQINQELETSLADAVIYAEDYLSPIPLDLAEAIVGSVRDTFQNLEINPQRRQLTPYIRNAKASYRIVGYIAFQIAQPEGMILDLVNALGLEKTEASQQRETRPLWQLLVCFTFLLRNTEISTADRNLIKTALKDFLQYLEHNPSIDPGRECRNRIMYLLQR